MDSGAGLSPTQWGAVVPRDNVESMDEVPVVGLDDGVWIGSAELCAIRVRRSGVAERHCQIHGTRTGVHLTDHSTTGTFINGARLVQAARPLKGGEEINVAGASFTFRAQRRGLKSTVSLDLARASQPPEDGRDREKTLSRYQTLKETMVRAGFD
eukprot:COSAG04_NODE_14906_length_550_cov_1.019956_1_plen_154_part_01